IFLGTVGSHTHADLPRQSLGLGPAYPGASPKTERGHHVQTFTAGCLAEPYQPEFLEPRAQLACGLDDAIERNIGCWIEIEDEAPRSFRVSRCAVPRVQFQRRDLGECCQGFDAIDLKIWLAIAGDLHEFYETRGAEHRVALKEPLASDSIGSTDDR